MPQRELSTEMSSASTGPRGFGGRWRTGCGRGEGAGGESGSAAFLIFADCSASSALTLSLQARSSRCAIVGATALEDSGMVIRSSAGT